MNYEVRAKTGTYTDKSGQEKSSYKTIGRTVQTKNGPMLKLDVIPMNWDGWAYLSEPQEKQAPQAKRPSHDAAKARDTRGSGFENMDDDVPW